MKVDGIKCVGTVRLKRREEKYRRDGKRRGGKQLFYHRQYN